MSKILFDRPVLIYLGQCNIYSQANKFTGFNLYDLSATNLAIIRSFLRATSMHNGAKESMQIKDLFACTL